MTDTNQSSVTAKAQEKALIGRLQQVAAFAKLSTKHMQVMRKAAKPVPLKEGQTLFAQGGEATGLFVLMQGALSVRRDNVEVSVIEPVATVGEHSVLMGDPYDEEAFSTTAGLVLHIPQAVFVALFDREQELFNRMSRGIIEDLCEELNRANLDQGQLATRRAELSKLMKEAGHELNDARMIHSMRR